MSVNPRALGVSVLTLAQSNRLLRITFPAEPSLDGAFVVAAWRGREALSACYEHSIDLLTEDAYRPLKSLVGLAVRLAIQTNTSTAAIRYIHGQVRRVEHRGADGGLARIRLVVVPFLALLELARDSRIFQDLSVPAIVEKLLEEARADNPLVRWRLALHGHYAPRSYCTMYRESVRAFIERLTAEEGIFWFFEHTDEAATLVLADAPDALAASPQETVPFHRTAPTEAQDSLITFEAVREIAAGAVTIASFDYKAERTNAGVEPTAHDHGAASGLARALEDYDPQTQYYADSAESARYARLRMEALESRAKRFTGSGSSRWAAAGSWQRVTGHPALDDRPAEARELVLVAVEHEARNNFSGDLLADLPASLVADDPALEPGTYRNRIEAQRRTVPFRAAYAGTAHARPTAWGLQTAIVVGPSGEEIYTDELGRVRVAFPWHRGDTRDERSTTWLRVASGAAGAAFGQLSLPRIGEEVLVGYIEDDIDRPVVIGRLYNGPHRPPAFSGAGTLPANRALSGWKTKTLGGSGYNELVFDDTPAEERVRLSTEAHATQLNQGALAHPRRDGKAEPRGAGFELRTDAAGALRAAQGILVTAAADPRAGGHQLARDEIVRQLREALMLAESLAQSAKSAGAEAADVAPQKELGERIAALDKSPASVVVAGAPAGIALTSPEAVAVHAGKDVALTAERDGVLTAAKRLLVHAGSAVSGFVSGVAGKIAIGWIARAGKVRIEAQSDDAEIVADRNVRVQSAHGEVLVSAEKSVTLVAGGAYIRLAGGRIEIHAPGEVSVKGAKHHLSGPASMRIDPPLFQSEDLMRAFVLKNEAGEILPDHPYKITREDGGVVEGVSDDEGRTRRVTSNTYEQLEVSFKRKPEEA